MLAAQPVYETPLALHDATYSSDAPVWSMCPGEDRYPGHGRARALAMCGGYTQLCLVGLVVLAKRSGCRWGEEFERNAVGIAEGKARAVMLVIDPAVSNS
jgi:hypothetical protein